MKNLQINLLPSSILYLFGTLLSSIFAFLYKDYIIKSFDLSTFGAFSFILSTISLISLYITLGYKDSLIFFIPRYLRLKKSDKIFIHIKNTILINSIMLLIILLVIFIIDQRFISESFNYNNFYIYKYHFFIILLLHSFISIFIEIINAFEKIHFSVLTDKILKWPVKFFFIIILLSAGYGFKGILFTEIISLILVFISLALLIYKISKTHGFVVHDSIIISRIEKSEKSYIKNIFSDNILSNLQGYMFTIMILFHSTYEVLGAFSLLNSIVFLITIILTSLNSVLKPIISKLYAKKNIKAIGDYFKLSCKLNFFMAIPISAIMYFFIEYIFIYIKLDISDFKVLFILLIFGQLINALKGPVFILIRMMGFAKELKYLNFFQLIINFLLYNFFIPKYGLKGIGLSIFLSFFVQAFMGSIFLYLRTRIHMYDKEYFAHILLSLLSIFIIYILDLITISLDYEHGQFYILAFGLILFFLMNLIYFNKRHNMFELFNVFK